LKTPKDTELDQEDHNVLARLLSSFESGTITVSVNNFPFMKVDSDSKKVAIEMRGFQESGLHFADLIETVNADKGVIQTIKQATGLAQSLQREGWGVRIFEGKDPLIAIGSGVSPLFGFVWFNPLMLPKISKLI
jgi:hypothetical protein